MSNDSTVDAECLVVEKLILEKYRTEPFHNLRTLYGVEEGSRFIGGSCSDKTLSFLNTLSAEGFTASLHSAFIGGQEVHRLARVTIEGRFFFADIGNGWPALKLYPADRAISYECFGTRFRSERDNNHLVVFHERGGREFRQVEIPMRSRPESHIMAEISARFHPDKTYPFSDSLRFAVVEAERFCFLRGKRLEIYSKAGVEVIENVSPSQLPHSIAGPLEPIIDRLWSK